MMENKLRVKLAGDLRSKSRETKGKFWARLSDELLASRQDRRAVNLGEISRHSKDGARVVVPGKVLGGGRLAHRVDVVAFEFSGDARAKISQAGGRSQYLSDFVLSTKETPKDVIILG
jgi:large subunit ribosomal protein L18e